MEKRDGSVACLKWPDWDLIRLSPLQREIYLSDARSQLLNMGRGGGKDFISILRMYRIALELYAQRKANARWFRPGAVVKCQINAPTTKNFEEAWDLARDLAPKAQGEADDGLPNLCIREKTFEIYLFGRRGIQVKCETLKNPNFQRGPGCDIQLDTEAAFFPESTLRSILLPSVKRPGFAGYLILYSTPQNNWFDVACDQASGKSEGYYSKFEYHHCTSFDNPVADEKEKEDWRSEEKINPYAYRRERLGELHIYVPPDDDPNQPGTRLYTLEELIGDGTPENPGIVVKTGCCGLGPFSFGHDLAGSGPDDYAIVGVCHHCRKVMHLEVHFKSDLRYIMERMKALHGEYDAPRQRFDQGGWIGAKAARKIKGLRCEGVLPKNPAVKGEIVTHFSQLVEKRGILLPDPESEECWKTIGMRRLAQRLLSEMQGYRETIVQSVTKRGETLTYKHFGKGRGFTDDLIDAAMLAALDLRVPREEKEEQIEEAQWREWLG